jgi:hypothetical protein
MLQALVFQYSTITLTKLTFKKCPHERKAFNR